jgi:hypothetical protein
VARGFNDRTYRVALTVNEIETFKQCIQDDDPLALQEAIDFFPFEESDLQALLNRPFTPPFREGRFSDGSHAVFYSAWERETAGDEYAHTAPSYFPATMRTWIFRLHLIDCHVLGTLADLRPLVATFPGLITNDHGFCREVGADAFAKNSDGLLAVSVRRAAGTNAAIFKRDCLSDPKQIGSVLCTVDAVAKTATYEFS